MSAFRPLPPPTRARALTRRASQLVADHGVFRVERRAYEGLPRDVFVLGCADWCNVIAETDGGDLVLVWQYRFGSDALSLEIPGGVIDPGESPEAAAVRELREETGYEAEHLELALVTEPNPALAGNRCFTFIARNARKTAPTAFDELEDLEVALVRLENIVDLLDSGQIRHALHALALERYVRLRDRRAGNAKVASP